MNVMILITDSTPTRSYEIIQSHHRILIATMMNRPQLLLLLLITTTHGLSTHHTKKTASHNNHEEQSRRAFLGTAITSVLMTTTIVSRPSAAAAAAESTTVVSTPSSTTFQESISGFVAGGALTGTKTLVKYPLDTVTVRLQMPSTVRGDLFKNVFTGIENPLLLNIPGGAVFFAVKDAVKTYLKQEGVSKPLATCISVFIANFPYWLIRNPSEVVKTKQQAASVLNTYNATSTAWEAFGAEREQNGLSGFYVGYWENIRYAYPADVIKFLIYEQMTGGAASVAPLEGAMVGAMATAVAQLLTTPLDVVRNRVMTNTTSAEGYLETFTEIADKEGKAALFKGAAPRVGKAILSGAIQFATYEETKQQILHLFANR